MSNFMATIHQIWFRLGLRPRSRGLRPRSRTYSVPPDHLAGFKGPTSNRRGRERREGYREGEERRKGREGKWGEGRKGKGIGGGKGRKKKGKKGREKSASPFASATPCVDFWTSYFRSICRVPLCVPKESTKDWTLKTDLDQVHFVPMLTPMRNLHLSSDL